MILTADSARTSDEEPPPDRSIPIGAAASHIHSFGTASDLEGSQPNPPSPLGPVGSQPASQTRQREAVRMTIGEEVMVPGSGSEAEQLRQQLLHAQKLSSVGALAS